MPLTLLLNFTLLPINWEDIFIFKLELLFDMMSYINRSTCSFCKFLTFSVLLFLVFSSTVCGQTVEGKKPVVALVMSGGGAKGFAHIGVLKVLEEEGIPVDIIVGTSIGGLVGGIYSLGYKASELESIVRSLDWEVLLSDDVPRTYLSQHDQVLKQRYLLTLPISKDKKITLPKGLIKGQNVINLFCGLAGELPVEADFNTLPVRFACMAADLEKGKEVVLNRGFFPVALYSSMSIPAVFRPSEMNGNLLVDGGAINNFPTDIAKAMGADIIIGVDIRNDFLGREKLQTIDNVVGQVVSFSDMARDSINKSLCNILIKPDITDYNIYSFNSQAADSLILRGERATRKLHREIMELRQRYSLCPKQVNRSYVSPQKWHITGITFSGKYQPDVAFMMNTLNLHIPGDYSREEIKNSIDRLYGLGGFELIYYNLVNSGGGKILNLNIFPDRILNQNVGLRVNTSDEASILLNTTRRDYSKIFNFVSLSGELSVNPGVHLQAEMGRKDFQAFGFDLRGKYQNYHLYREGTRLSSAGVFGMAAGAYAYKPLRNGFHFVASFEEQYFSFKNLAAHETITPVNGDNFLTRGALALSYDSFDDFYFPQKGTNLFTEFSVLENFRKEGRLSPLFLVRMKNAIPAGSKLVFLLDFHSRLVFSQSLPLPAVTLAGGEPWSDYFSYHLPFYGLPAATITGRFTYTGLTGARIKLSSSQYLSFLFNIMSEGNRFAPWQNGGLVTGGGIKYSRKSIIGPLELFTGYSPLTGKVVISASLGYWF